MLASGAINVEKTLSAVITMEEAVEEFRHPAYSKRGKVLVAVDPTLEKNS